MSVEMNMNAVIMRDGESAVDGCQDNMAASPRDLLMGG